MTNPADHLKIAAPVKSSIPMVDAASHRKQTATVMLGMSRWQRAAMAVIVAAILYLPALGRPPLLEPDEGRYGEIAREMISTADYVTPHNDWVPYLEKPPLVYWMTAATLRSFGHNEFAVRIPAALFSAGQVGITEFMGEMMFGAPIGILSAIALMLSPIFLGFARFATLDPALSFFITAAMAAFYPAAEAGFDSLRGRILVILSSALLAFGTMTKGPVAPVIGGSIALIYLVISGRSREILKIPWIAAIAVYLAIVTPWFVLAARSNPGFLHFFFMHEHVARYLVDREHGWGPYFFVVVAAAGTWPWIYFALHGAIRLWRGDRASAMERRALSFLFIWFGLVMVFFSIPRSKLGSYILPAIPPVAILAGYGLQNFLERPASRRFIAWFAIINATLAIAISAAVVLLAGALPADILADGAIAAGALMLIAIAPAIAATAGCRRTAIGAMALGVLAIAAAAAKAREDGAAYYSYRRLAGVVAPRLGPGCFLGSYHHFVQSMPFYTGSREALIDFRGELGPFSGSSEAAASFVPDLRHLEQIWSTSPCAVVIVNFHDLDRVAGALDPKPSILGCEGKKVALYNKPVSGAPAMYDCGGAFGPDQRAEHGGGNLR